MRGGVCTVTHIVISSPCSPVKSYVHKKVGKKKNRSPTYANSRVRGSVNSEGDGGGGERERGEDTRLLG